MDKIIGKILTDSSPVFFYLAFYYAYLIALADFLRIG